MPISRLPTWSTAVTDVEGRLAKLSDVLTRASQPDGSVDLKQAKALAGKDVITADLVQTVRVDFTRQALDAAEARRAFMELNIASTTAPDLDTNGDGRLGYRELAMGRRSDDLAERLVYKAAMPTELSDGERAKPRVALSREARREAEAVIMKTARFHAETPLGVEALAWDMRERVVSGLDIGSAIVFDAVNFSERDWRAKLPLIGERYRGQGHLSDAELTQRFGDLEAFVARKQGEVNARLMMDYVAGFLAGSDLP
ncbi:MAG: hypothetical protein JNK82_32975 [Myxococcaceae bacterium]|nr:hypothetical protein [Myxococcaceae bacterium]